jgi:uncharacterized membrane protein
VIFFRLREFARSGLLVTPSVITVGLLALSIVVVRVDGSVDTAVFGGDLFRGGVESARAMMTAIAGATVSLTALVFSITMLVLQMAAGQYSPRVLRTFLRDRNSHVTLGIFVGTFAYALSALRALGANERDAPPDLVMTVAIVLALVTVGAFVQYIDHIARMIRVTNLIDVVARETHAAIDERYPRAEAVDAAEPMPQGGRILLSPSAGSLVAVDEPALVALADRFDAVVVVLHRIGDFVPRGSPLCAVVCEDDIPDRLVLRHVNVGRERTMAQDPAYGFRQLVDIALRALSPSMNDPTTAVQVLDQLHDLTRELSSRRLGDRVRHDRRDVARLFVPDRTWADYLHLAIDEIGRSGREQVQVAPRLRALLDDLAHVATGERRRVVARERSVLEARTDLAPERAARTLAGAPGPPDGVV